MTDSAHEEAFRNILANILSKTDESDLANINEIALEYNALNEKFGIRIPDHRAVKIATELASAHKNKLELGATVRNESTFDPWLDERKAEVEMRRGAAYDRLLIERGWGKSVVRTLGKQTDRIVELLGDPEVGASWSRKGLVIGEVQSGKTATYIGVLNKAIDLGYQIVVVIGGHTEDLRRQTQERLDSDLIGDDTSFRSDGASRRHNTRIGVGRIDETIGTTALTSARYDFSMKTAESTTVNLATGNPTVFVVKKNSSVLKSLAKYIRSTAVGDVHNVPLVVIDDESDWASVNTSAKDKERTAVNRAIIDLLSVSRRNSYLGITATPFANILIADDKEARDLFPRDYIMALESPSTYRGVDFYFPPEGDESENIDSGIDDFHELLPQKHKKDAVVNTLARSLKDAILAFFVATAERYRRDGAKPPSSMMVNVSRFNAVQKKFSVLIEDYVESVGEAILASAGYFGEGSDATPRIIRDLQRVANAQFASQKIDVRDLGKELQRVAEDIHIDLVNGLTMKDRNDRLATFTRKSLAEWKQRPAIYVGGNVLARGLTLDGLVVSYFTRRAGAADTLLQMGRWFGHRPGYDDLTRVWMDREVIDHFTYVAGVSQDLRSSVAEMRDLNLTPREFGLKIRLHPETSFLITAANKQRAGVKHDSPGVFSYRGKAFETHTIPNDEQLTEQNRQAVLGLLEMLPAGDAERRSGSRNIYWRGVAHEIVENFLHKFSLNTKLPTSKVFGIGSSLPAGIASVGRQCGWTIGLMSGSGKKPVTYLAEADLPYDVDARASYRNNVELSEDGKDLRLSQRRLATGGNIVASVASEERAAALAARKKSKSYSGSNDSERELTQSEVLRAGLKSPMLLIYTVSIGPESTSAVDASMPPEKRNARRRLSELKEVPALVMATPGLSEQETREDLESGGTKFGSKYIVNSVYARLELGLGDWDDVDEDEGAGL